jgi:hypothetical protein
MADYGPNFITGGTPTARSVFSAGYEVEKACDGNTATRWAEGAQAVGGWWKYDLGVGVTKKGNKLTLSFYPDDASQYIKGFILYGSNDDSTYTEIYSGTMTLKTQTFTFTNTEKYRYYKIIMGENDVAGHWYNIVEFLMYEDVTATGGFLSTYKKMW